MGLLETKCSLVGDKEEIISMNEDEEISKLLFCNHPGE